MDRSVETGRPVERGFTLVELLVVLVIMGIAAAMVIPRMGDTGSVTVEGAARAIMSDLMYAQSEALGRQVQRQVVFSTDDNTYRLADENNQTLNATWMNGAYQVNFNTDGRFRGVRIDAVNFGGGQTVSFDDLGTPSDGGTIDIVNGERRFRITVTAFTGRVSIESVATPAETEVVEGESADAGTPMGE